MIPAYALSKDAEECADQTDDQQQSDAGNGLPVLLLHQEEQAEGQSQRDQLGQDAIQNALDNDGAVAVLDDGSNGGAAVVGSQSTDDEDAQHGSRTGELLRVGSQDVDSLGAQIVRPVHQEEAAYELHDVKDKQEQDGASQRTVDGHVRGDTCGDGNQSEPEDSIADAAQRAHSGDTHGTDGVDVSLLLLQREDDAHDEGDQERVSVEELQVVLHGELQVVLVVCVDLLQTGQDAVQPAGGLHTLVVEGCLQVQGTKHHLVQPTLIQRMRRSQIVVMSCIRCHLRRRLHSQQNQNQQPA